MLLLISLTLLARWYQGGPTSMGSEPAAPAAGGVACPATITLITINPDPNAVRNRATPTRRQQSVACAKRRRAAR